MGSVSADNLDKFNAVLEIHKDVVYAIDNIGDFVDKDRLNKRRYVHDLPKLENLVHEINGIVKKKSLFGNEKVDESEYRRVAKDVLDCQAEVAQSKLCTGCRCFKCIEECAMKGCDGCEAGKCSIALCDNKTVLVYKFYGKTIELCNNETGENESHEVLAVIDDPEFKQGYIVLGPADDDDEKLILYYNHGVNGDEFGAIEDADDINFAAEAYEKVM